MKIVTKIGRFFRSEMKQFYAELHEAGRVSRQKTEHERIKGYIENSLNRDLIDEYTAKAHGHDIGQIGKKAAASQDAFIEIELKRVEAAYLRSVIEAARTLMQQAESRLSEVDTETGTSAFRERVAAINAAKRKIS
jgi:hypothetical protein